MTKPYSKHSVLKKSGACDSLVSAFQKPIDQSLSPLVGVPLIRSLIKKLPSNPGVYRMIGHSDEVLYVGKAYNLKKRVASYTRKILHTHRIEYMVRETVAMEFILTRSETEALLLEAHLIKRFKPRYNVLMRDDKSFPSIIVTSGSWPGIFKYRGKFSEKGECFGPFASAHAVSKTINSLQKAFLIRSCSDSFFKNRTRPCLLHQMRRCAAPCTGEISSSDYAGLVHEAKEFLAGRNQKIKAGIIERMHKASESLDFERAALYRDRLSALSHTQSHQGVDVHSLHDTDVFALCQEAGKTCIQVFFFRNGQNRGGKAYFPHADLSFGTAQIFSAFLAQFYNSETPPRMILTSSEIEDRELLARALSLHAGYGVTIMTPQRGQKKDIVNHALQNAKAALIEKLSETGTHKNLLKDFADAFGLHKTPARIEVYDNSHFMGNSCVGVMIVAGGDGFIKSQYRKFNMRSTGSLSGDDYSMMREVMRRRFSHFFTVSSLHGLSGDKSDSWPDVIVIDGGAAHMAVVEEELNPFDPEHSIFIVALAKGEGRQPDHDHFFLRGGISFSLSSKHSVFHFLQRLRDEAHRFAVGAHRLKRKKQFIMSPLNGISGIGSVRKRGLLLHFGTVQAISRASVRDLMMVKGISKAIASEIYDYFHS